MTLYHVYLLRSVSLRTGVCCAFGILAYLEDGRRERIIWDTSLRRFEMFRIALASRLWEEEKFIVVFHVHKPCDLC